MVMTAVSQKPLPPIIKAASPELEAEIRARVRDLVGARPLPFMRQLIGAWCVIVIAISLAIWLDNVWMSLITIFLVATRQNLLGLLVHEQVHRLGSRGRYGDLITNLFAAYPLLVLTVEGYAQVHLAHHKYFYTEKDPDYGRKSGLEWSIPMSRGQFVRMFLQDILGINTLRLIRSKKPETNLLHDEFRRRHPTPPWVRPTFWVIIAAALWYSGGWIYFSLVLDYTVAYRCPVPSSARRTQRT
jgi:fatty acid desaturase